MRWSTIWRGLAMFSWIGPCCRHRCRLTELADDERGHLHRDKHPTSQQCLAAGWRRPAASASDELPSATGLVPYAITVRDHETQPDWTVDGLWKPAFPGPELLGAAADLLPSIQDASGRSATLSEGPRWEVVVSPGVIRVRTRDYTRAERASERRPLSPVPRPASRDGVRTQAQQGWCFSDGSEGTGVPSSQPPSYTTHAGLHLAYLCQF
jgi:hypothetical protein